VLDKKWGDGGVVDGKGGIIDCVEDNLRDAPSNLGWVKNVLKTGLDVSYCLGVSVDIHGLSHDEIDLSHLVESSNMIVV